MSTPPSLRVIEGGKCPPQLIASTERALDRRLDEISADLRVYVAFTEHDLEDEELTKEITNAIASIQLAQLALARRRKR